MSRLTNYSNFSTDLQGGFWQTRNWWAVAAAVAMAFGAVSVAVR